MAKRFSIAILAVLPLLAGCVSFGEDPPPQLLTLTAAEAVPDGASTNGVAGDALAVHEPEAPASIDVLRVPVRVDNANLAYLQDAVWVEKPARLFRRVLAETIRARTQRLVIDADEAVISTPDHLRGTLRKFDYDASRSAVVVQFDAIRQSADGALQTRRFEEEVGGIAAEPVAVGAALNQAANTVAAEVADWVSGAG